MALDLLSPPLLTKSLAPDIQTSLNTDTAQHRILSTSLEEHWTNKTLSSILSRTKLSIYLPSHPSHPIFKPSAPAPHGWKQPIHKCTVVICLDNSKSTSQICHLYHCEKITCHPDLEIFDFLIVGSKWCNFLSNCTLRIPSPSYSIVTHHHLSWTVQEVQQILLLPVSITQTKWINLIKGSEIGKILEIHPVLGSDPVWHYMHADIR